MNNQLAGLLGVLIPDYGMSPVPDGFYDSGIITSVQPTVESLPVALPVEIQMEESIEKSTRESAVSVPGTSKVSIPIASPKSVGGDPTRPSDIGKGSTKDTGSWWDNPNATTAFQVEHYLNGTVQGMKAISAIGNGYAVAGQYQMKAATSEYMARQNIRNANNMLANIKEINRAAQNDMNVMSEQNVKRKSEQRIAQGASGFAVGKGSYQVLSDNTDWKTNFNASMIALKAGYQGAEVIRAAGGLEAQSIISKAEADIARMNAKTSKLNGWINGIAGLTQSGASFYIGSTGSN